MRTDCSLAGCLRTTLILVAGAGLSQSSQAVDRSIGALPLAAIGQTSLEEAQRLLAPDLGPGLAGSAYQPIDDGIMGGIDDDPRIGAILRSPLRHTYDNVQLRWNGIPIRQIVLEAGRGDTRLASITLAPSSVADLLEGMEQAFGPPRGRQVLTSVLQEPEESTIWIWHEGHCEIRLTRESRRNEHRIILFSPGAHGAPFRELHASGRNLVQPDDLQGFNDLCRRKDWTDLSPWTVLEAFGQPTLIQHHPAGAPREDWIYAAIQLDAHGLPTVEFSQLTFEGNECFSCLEVEPGWRAVPPRTGSHLQDAAEFRRLLAAAQASTRSGDHGRALALAQEARVIPGFRKDHRLQVVLWDACFERRGLVFIDRKTGLMWQSIASESVEAQARDDRIRQLNFRQYGGYGDWRLPAGDELLGLYRNLGAIYPESGRLVSFHDDDPFALNYHGSDRASYIRSAHHGEFVQGNWYKQIWFDGRWNMDGWATGIGTAHIRAVRNPGSDPVRAVAGPNTPPRIEQFSLTMGAQPGSARISIGHGSQALELQAAGLTNLTAGRFRSVPADLPVVRLQVLAAGQAIATRTMRAGDFIRGSTTPVDQGEFRLDTPRGNVSLLYRPLWIGSGDRTLREVQFEVHLEEAKP